MWEEHPGWWAVTKKSFFTFIICSELTGQKKFSNCPKFLKHEKIFRMPQKFGHKWKLSLKASSGITGNHSIVSLTTLSTSLRWPPAPANISIHTPVFTFHSLIDSSCNIQSRHNNEISKKRVQEGCFGMNMYLQTILAIVAWCSLFYHSSCYKTSRLEVCTLTRRLTKWRNGPTNEWKVAKNCIP
jgi:hypothetical protein